MDPVAWICLGAHRGREETVAVGGLGATFGGAPATSAAGETADGERRTAVIMVVSSASFPASLFGGYGRLEADGGAGTPAMFSDGCGVLREGGGGQGGRLIWARRRR
jgi:hypothetical protein